MNRIEFYKRFISNDPYDKQSYSNLAILDVKKDDVVLVFINAKDISNSYYGIYAALKIVNDRFKGYDIIELSNSQMPLTFEIDKYVSNIKTPCINDRSVRYGVVEHKILCINKYIEKLLSDNNKYKLLSMSTKKEYSNIFDPKAISMQLITNVNIPEDIDTKEFLECLFLDNAKFWLDYQSKDTKDLLNLSNKVINEIYEDKKKEDNKKRAILTRVNDDGLSIQDMDSLYFEDYSSIRDDTLVFETTCHFNEITGYKGVINGEVVISNNFYDDFNAVQKQFDKASRIISVFCYKDLKILMNQGISISNNHLLFDLSKQLLLHKQMNFFEEKLESLNRDRLLETIKVTYKVNSKNKFCAMDLCCKSMCLEQQKYINDGDEASLYDKRIDTYLWNEFVEAIEYNERMPYSSEIKNILFDKKHFINFSVDLKDKFWMYDDIVGKIYFKQDDNLFDDIEEL